MSLEKEIADLRESVSELTAVTKTLIALRTDAIETVKSSAAPKAATSKSTEAKAEEPKVEQADEYAEAKGLVAAYTKGSDRPEEQQARKTKIRALLRHKVLVKPELADEQTTFAVTDVMPEQIGRLVQNLNALIEKGDLTQPASANDEDLV